MIATDLPRAHTLSPAYGIAVARFAVGLYFLISGFDKITKGWLASPEILLNTFLTGPQGALTRGTVEPFYRPFLEHVVVPNAGLFAQMTALGEVAVGVSLMFGLLTRVGAIGGIFLNLNYMLMKGLANGGGSNDRLFVALELVFLLTAAGLVWGLDGQLGNRLGANSLVGRLLGASAEPRALRRPGPG